MYAPTPYPILTKARTPGDDRAVLLPIDMHRYLNAEFLRIFQGDPTLDTPFEAKAPKAVWRGAPSDVGWDPAVSAPANTRRGLLERWWINEDESGGGRVDVGLSSVEFLPKEFRYRCLGFLVAVLGRDYSCLCTRPLPLCVASALDNGLFHTHREHWRAFIKPQLSVAEQLQNRYILAVEGTNLLGVGGGKALLFSLIDKLTT